MKPGSLIYVAGHRGMVGAALVRRLKADDYHNLVLKTHAELDLTNQAAVDRFFAEHRPEFVFLAAAKVGGILANDTRPAEFLKDNIAIQTNVIDAAYRHGTQKLLFLGSSCIYPKEAPQPMHEECLLTGPLEQTNEWYAVAKIAGLKMCQAYRKQFGFNAISAMPTNLYGPHDNFELQSSHVLPALIRKFHEGKERGQSEVEIWGTGSPRREFLHVDDLADACILLMERYESDQWINVGCGSDITIAELAGIVQAIVGYRGSLRFDTTRPDGVARKRLNVDKITALGWRSQIGLEAGIRATYDWFVKNRGTARTR
jgi:GDP-L-fucose synthase